MMEDVSKGTCGSTPDSEDEDAEFSSKQGRILQEEGLDEMVRNMMKDKSEVFKTPTQGKTSGEEDISPTTLEAAKTLSKVASQRSKSVDKGKRYKRRKESKGEDISTGFEDISTGFEDISIGFEEVNTGGARPTKAQLKRYGEELQTEISKKQRIDDNDVLDTEEKVGKVKEEEPVKRVGKRNIAKG
ncbi:hypothetical protein Tco_0761977 [Tanacetum coccineum]